MGIALLARRLLNLPTASDYTARLIATGEVRTALDVGCGGSSHLTAFRRSIRTVGLDGHEAQIEASRRVNAHDEYIHADLMARGAEDVLARWSGQQFDLVTLYGVVEHLPKRVGFDLLERCEALTSKYILIETPNGFCPQGPEFGNPMQRHLSGWFQHEFEGLGYDVYGTTGTKYLRGYVADKRYPWFKGSITIDYVLARVLVAHRWPRHAFNLIAIKDVRGVPARLG
jgi:2-polyprenyl-3-methyl-5-hydroxy-6-metoxy-1,4-benzoquinol methylase